MVQSGDELLGFQVIKRNKGKLMIGVKSVLGGLFSSFILYEANNLGFHIENDVFICVRRMKRPVGHGEVRNTGVRWEIV